MRATHVARRMNSGGVKQKNKSREEKYCATAQIAQPTQKHPKSGKKILSTVGFCHFRRISAQTEDKKRAGSLSLIPAQSI